MQIWDAILDGIIDTAKLIPFLFLTYLVMEYIEHHTSDKTRAAIRRADRFGPLVGGILGAVPQCGFSAAASSLYAGRVITGGTLIAVFLSTSDEMLPIFLSNRVGIGLIVKIIVIKAVYGVIAGFIVDFLFRSLNVRKIGAGIHGICEAEHCDCEKGIFVSSLKHTFSIALYIFIISVALNLFMEAVGTENLENIVFNQPVIGEVLAGLIGLIPNCAASVALTTMYLDGAMSAGAMMSGLMVGAGVGLLVLFRANRSRRESAKIVLILYAAGVVGGLLTSLLRLF
ncbi:MAG: arsenic efflux protein [Lachnospiraceae bacterium]|nr:arsenic efflux protein [Lachnospiraceae bacterium]